jgi:predicted component of type VI protein secretion system
VTQTALDETALESLKTLSAQQVNVPVLIEQTLDENGKPTSVNITTASMPLTSIITPSMQQVDQMTLRMDMRVQSFDATSGIKFNQNMASTGMSFSLHNFGFAASVNNTNVNAQFSNMSDFSSGSVMMSVDIVDRTGFQIPTPLEYGIGANVLVRLTSVTQASVTTGPAPNTVTTIIRSALLTVKKVSTTGAVTDLNSGGYGVSVPAGLTFTQGPDSATSLPAGTLRIVRTLATTADPYVERKISVNLNQLTKEVSFFI